MPDLICDPTFEYGLWNWANSPGVEVVDAELVAGTGVTRHVAKVPPAGYLAQSLPNLHPVGDLNFLWFSLGSAEPAMNVRVDYADSTYVEREFRSNLFGDPMAASVPLAVELEGHRGITSFRLDNVGAEGQDWGVHFFPIRGRDDEFQLCEAPFRAPYYWGETIMRRLIKEMRASQPRELRALLPQGFLSDEMDAKLEAKLFSIDMKLNKLLELLTRDQKSRSSKSSGKSAIEA